MSIEFTKATRKGQFLRLGIDGPSGAGKSLTSLLIARHLVGPEGTIRVIDTEEGSSALYSPSEEGGEVEDLEKHRIDFDIFDWTANEGEHFDIAKLTDYLRQLSGKQDIILVDGMSPFWSDNGGVNDVVAASNVKNNMQAWGRVGNPLINKFFKSVTQMQNHIILTFRSKQDYVESKDGKGRTRYERVGTSPQFKVDSVFVLTMLATIDPDNSLSLSKSRCNAIPTGHKPFPPDRGTKEFADIVRDWLNTADAIAADDAMDEAIDEGFKTEEAFEEATSEKAPDPATTPISGGEATEIREHFGEIEDEKARTEAQDDFRQKFNINKVGELTRAQYTDALEYALKAKKTANGSLEKV